MKNKWIIWIIIVCELLLLNQCYRKNGIRWVDDIWSYMVSNSNGYAYIETNEWLTGEEARQYITLEEGEQFNYKAVMQAISKDNHAPVYFLILHTVNSFFPGVFSKWTGLSINLILFPIMLWLFYLLAKRFMTGIIPQGKPCNRSLMLAATPRGGVFTRLSSQKCPCKQAFLLPRIKREFWALLATFAFGTSLQILGIGIAMRPYLLLLTVGLAFVIYCEKYYETNKKRDLAFVFILATLGMLTHYYFYVFAFWVTLTYLVLFFKQKRMHALFAFGSIMILSVIVSLLCYPTAIMQFFNPFPGHERQTQLKDIKYLINNFLNIISRIAVIFTCLFLPFRTDSITLVSISLTILGIFLLVQPKFKIERYFCFSFLNLILLSVIAPYMFDVDFKYFILSAPFLFIFIFSKFACLEKFKKLFVTYFIIISIFSAFLPTQYTFEWCTEQFPVLENSNIMVLDYNGIFKNETTSFIPTLKNYRISSVDDECIIQRIKEIPDDEKLYLLTIDFDKLQDMVDFSHLHFDEIVQKIEDYGFEISLADKIISNVFLNVYEVRAKP